MMGFYIMLCTVHTAQGQGTIVFHCVHPGPCPVSGTVQYVWAIKGAFTLMEVTEWRPIFALAQFKCAQGRSHLLPLQKLMFLSEMRRHILRFIHTEWKRSRFQQVSCPPWAKTTLTCAIFHVRFCSAWTDPYLLNQHHCPVQFEVNCYVNCASSGSAWSP